MPSYLRNPYRSYSYPPTLEGIEEDYENNLPDIDEDPFAHFITPIDDEDPYDMSLSAGIMVADGPRASKASKFKFNVADKWTRYIKQSHTGLHKQHHTTTIVEEEEDEDEEESFMGLDDARLNERPSPVRHTTPPRGTTTVSTRGRAPELVTRKLQNRRRNLRTLSGHRHSWRAPSPDLFTVDESEEDELPVLRRSRTRKAKDGAERRRSSTRSQSRMRGDMTERARL
ncbi:hypothetical protein HBI75_050420 [Parastagonospora nodorum]|nr:hypothetical protein HBI75_050420 [Parastagonospora nodorum]KAH5482337.1 hypothetical protein HBI28_009970 [Parastagonospora nodorum]KAH5648369.1 hypothetical protein HBI22_013520 [Parastagonospora nodorum]KAH5683055.1 hypothetical protein HBI21_039280 [Parastagonospora nodorum]